MSLGNDASPAPVTRDAGARRAKTYRSRRRQGLRCVTIKLDTGTIQAFEENGYLDDGRDSLQLAKAVELFISDHIAAIPV